jgi:hypothetical protein
MLFSTLGSIVSHLMRSRFQIDLHRGFFEVAATVDFIVWFAGIWGIQKLWAQFHGDTQVTSTSHWSNPRSASTWAGVALITLPFSYYLLLGAALLVNHGSMPEATFYFIASVALCLTLGAVAIYGSFALTARFWPTSDDEKKKNR